MEVENSVSNDLKKPNYIPPSGVSSTRLFMDDVITAVSVEGVRLLANKYSQALALPLINKFSSPLELAKSLQNIEESIEQSFIDALGWVYRFSSEEIVDKFTYMGIAITAEENIGEFISRVLVDHDKSFFSVLNKFLVQDTEANKTFRLFKDNTKRPPVDKLSIPTEKIINSFEEKFSKYLYEKSCGSFCKLSITYINDNLCMFIDRAGKKSGMTFVGEDNSLACLMLRNRKCDFVLFDPLTQCIWVSATGKDIEAFRALFSEMLFGESSAYSTAVNFDLSFLRSDNIEAEIANTSGKIRKEVRLAGASFKQAGVYSDDRSFSTGRTSGTLFDCEQSSFMKDRLSSGLGSYAKLVVVIDEERKVNDIIHVKPKSINYKRLLDVEELLAVFSILGIVEAYRND